MRGPDVNPLSLFHPLCASWFAENLGEPSDIQAQSWPVIAAGKNALIIAPTGSGKTMAAFFHGLNRLIRGELPRGAVSLLYVSPLKALNNDVRRNLTAPLEGLSRVFADAGTPFAPIHVMTRSGDTPQSERRRMLRHPPEILITTPESLNLLLSSQSGRGLLSTVRAVILDEIHAVLGEKRGTHLITAVDRLVPLCGEFQRLALSATVKPEDEAAAFVAGRRMEGPPDNPVYRPRDMAVIHSYAKKRYDARVEYPEEAAGRDPATTPVWGPLAREFRKRIAKNRTTLFFVNDRRLCERLAHAVNNISGEKETPGRDPSEPRARLVYAHHGSLSRELRESVEEKLKSGELGAVIATNSLELGIDVGQVDEVALVRCPPSIASALQRIGRAGHRAGEISRGVFYPTHGKDFIECAVMVKAVLAQDIEETRPVMAPLDVLAQIIVSMTLAETWDADALYARILTSYPYKDLPRKYFDLTLSMLAGRYANARIRALRPKIVLDGLDNTVKAAKGAAMDLYASGGVIPDRGYYAMRHAATGARLGELDEVFVWEASVGQAFSLGAQYWRIERITHSDVFVAAATPNIKDAPFWIGEQRGRDFHFSERLAEFLEDADARLADKDYPAWLESACGMTPEAAGALAGYLKAQKEATRTGLPHRHRLVLERTSSGPGGAAGGTQFALHMPWGLRLTRPYALALDAAFEERFGERPLIYAANDVIALVLPHETDAAELFSLVTASRLEELLRRRLEGSGVFGAAFREAAGRALLLPKRSFKQRMPLWMTRLRSQELLEAVSGAGDFPLMIEAWRTCLRETFDMENLVRMLGELEDGLITVAEARTSSPSPMAREIAWRQITDRFMYMTDEARRDMPSSTSSDVLKEALFSPGLRPSASREVCALFEQKRQRLFPEYAPSGPDELLDWLRERLLIPVSEWKALGRAMLRDHGLSLEAMETALGAKLVRIAPERAKEPLAAAMERLPEILESLYPGERPALSDAPVLQTISVRRNGDAAAPAGLLAGEWLSYYGPRRPEFLAETLGLDPGRAADMLGELAEERTVVAGELVTGEASELVCDAANFEIILRMARAAARPAFETLPASRLQPYLAHRQGLCPPGEDAEDLLARLERLSFYPLPAASLEKEVIPARMRGMREMREMRETRGRGGDDPGLLREVFGEGGLLWLGAGEGKIQVSRSDELDLAPQAALDPGDAALLTRLFPDPRGRYDFSALLEITGLRPGPLSDLLWKLVFKGLVTNDDFAALRKGAANKFTLPETAGQQGGGRFARSSRSGRSGRTALSGRRSAMAKWSGALPYAGAWRRLPLPDLERDGEEAGDDPLEAMELAKDRARVLLDRYGVVFRELLAREAPDFSWASLFRALRLMELSGETVAGRFFEGVPGAQFAEPAAVAALARESAPAGVWWMAASDPASLCGLGLPEISGALPKRLSGVFLAYAGETLGLVAEGNGKLLDIRVPPDHPELPRLFAPLRALLGRRFEPVRRLALETVNGLPVAESPYLDALRGAFEVLLDHKGASLYLR